MQFSGTSKILLSQLKSCDEANIAGHIVDDNLDGNWGVDACRRLVDWDVPGCLSAAAFPVLQKFGNYYRSLEMDPAMDGRKYQMEYLAVISGESDDNQTWRDKFDCDDWNTLFKTVILAGEEPDEQKVYVRDTTYLGKPARFFSIPFYTEGFSAYLLVYVNVVNRPTYEAA